MNFWMSLFDTSDFPARWHCGQWTSGHGWLHILSDLAVWSAYFAIPGVLLYFILQRRDLPFRKIFWLFGAFILLCGTTHLMEAIIFWWPAYRLAGVIKFLTAAVSWTTVFALAQATPRVMQMRTPKELEREITARQAAEEALKHTNAELERRVEQRTAELSAAVAALRSEREWFSTTLASIGDGVITTDLQGRVTLLNPVAQKLTGWDQPAAEGQPLIEVFHIINEDSRQTVSNPALVAIEQGTIVGLANHSLLIGKDGVERPIDDSAAPLKAPDGTVTGAVLIFRDIAERRELERQNAERLASARFLAAIIESSDDAIVSKALDGKIQSWNAGAERLFGYSAKEAIGSPITLIVPPEREDEEDEIISTLRQEERVESFETVRVRKDGELIHVSLTMSPIRDEEGRVVGASKIARDITERKLVEQRIDNLLAQLKEADRRKDVFLATLAHEIRNPLAPIRTGLEVMKLAGHDPAIFEQVRGTMERQAQQLVVLVDDLLDVSRITQGKFQLKKARVNLADVITSVIEATRTLIEEAGHELVLNIPAAPIYLEADPHRLAQVISNLLINAVKFTPDKGRIWLTAERRGSEVRISVKDNGVGIAPAFRDSIFEMFVQVDGLAAHSQVGLGIGLTLVKALVEMHEGTVEVHSDGPHQGSEFSIRLPVLDSPVAEEASIPQGQQPAEVQPQRRVLVVDDNTSAAEVLALLVKMFGNEVRTAHNGEQALALAEEFRPDLVLMDLGMPVMDGLEAARRMRETPWGKELLLIALTGWGQAEDKRRTQEGGFDGHLVKPAESAELQKLFARIDEKRSATGDASANG